MSAVSVPCGICPESIPHGVERCPGCGRGVTDQDRAVLQVRLEAGDFEAHQRGRRVRAGSKWIGALAILFAIAAPIVYAMQSSQVDKALERLRDFADDEQLTPIDGVTYTAGQLRQRLGREASFAAGLNLALAVMMGGLWLWARRAPLPALACALALYVVVLVGSALYDPSTIAQGILVKVVAIGALVKGLRAALAARAAMRA
jgi:hypothetical protein